MGAKPSPGQTKWVGQPLPNTWFLPHCLCSSSTVFFPRLVLQHHLPCSLNPRFHKAEKSTVAQGTQKVLGVMEVLKGPFSPLLLNQPITYGCIFSVSAEGTRKSYLCCQWFLRQTFAH